MYTLYYTVLFKKQAVIFHFGVPALLAKTNEKMRIIGTWLSGHFSCVHKGSVLYFTMQKQDAQAFLRGEECESLCQEPLAVLGKSLPIVLIVGKS